MDSQSLIEDLILRALGDPCLRQKIETDEEALYRDLWKDTSRGVNLAFGIFPLLSPRMNSIPEYPMEVYEISPFHPLDWSLVQESLADWTLSRWEEDKRKAQEVADLEGRIQSIQSRFPGSTIDQMEFPLASTLKVVDPWSPGERETLLAWVEGLTPRALSWIWAYAKQEAMAALDEVLLEILDPQYGGASKSTEVAFQAALKEILTRATKMPMKQAA